MDKKQKARKHLLRRLITNAALAGTAFSTFGGALATTMEVKADERYPGRVNVTEMLKRYRKEALREVITKLYRQHPGIAQNYLLSKIDDLDKMSRVIEEGEKANKFLKADRQRLEEELEKYHKKILEAIEINSGNEERIDELEKEKKGLEELLAIAEDQVQQKEEDIEKVNSALETETRRANLNSLGVHDMEMERNAARKQVAELEAKLARVSKEYDDFAKLAAAAQEDYEKELALDEQKLKDQEDKNKELSANLKTAEEFYHERQAKLAEAEKAKTQLMSELENAQKALETAESSMSEYAEKVETLKAELEASKTEAEELKAKAEEVDKELASTKEAKASLEKEIEDMKAKQAEEVAKLEALLREKGADISRLETELANKVKAFEDKEKMSEQEKAQFQADIERLQKELADKMTAKMPEPLANKGDGQEKSLPNPVNHNIPKVEEKKEEGHQLPSTGEKAANPLLVAAGLTFLLGAGSYAYAGRSKKD